jgi:predicted nucleotidyltransferase
MNLPDHLTPSERRAIEQALQEVTSQFPIEVRFIALFGSKARGDFGPESDIDLLIVRENDDWPTRHAVRAPVYDAAIEHGVFISVWAIGWERFQSLPVRRPGLFANLCRDAIELWRRPGTENPLKLPEPSLTA